MSVKIIQITIPCDISLLDIINTFSPEENYIMLKIGSETIRESRKVVARLAQKKEIYQKIKNKSKDDI